MSDEYFWLFSQLGLVHLLSASGYHMGVALWFSGKITTLFKKPILKSIGPNFYVFFECTIATGFMFLLANKTGWGKPMVRAFCVSILWMIGKNSFRLNVNKKWIFLWSILISYFWGQGSTLSCLLSAAAISSFFLCDAKKKWQYLLAPWLFTLPITIFYFHYLSLSAPIANLLFSPLISFFCLIPSFIALFFETIHFASGSNFLWNLSSNFLKQILTPMKWLAEFGPPGIWTQSNTLFLLFPLLLLFLYLFKKTKLKYFLLCGVFLTTLILQNNFLPSAHILDVQQGDSILLQSTNSKPFLVDFGPPGHNAYPGPVTRSIAQIGIHSLEGLLLTHPDLDHIGALPHILLRYPIESKTAWSHSEIFNEDKFFPYLAWLERAGIKLNFIYTNTRPYDGLICATMGHVKNANNLSPLCSFTLGNGEKLLLTGDMDKKAESYYMQNTSHLIKSKYIKLAHHGSHSSSSYDFLLASGAKIALVSAGFKNRYHHPHVDVIGRTKSLNMKVLQTSISGTLKIN